MKLNLYATACCALSWLIPVCAYAQFDCNNNSVDDAVDIQNGTATDCNNNGIPDSCDIVAAPVFSIQQSTPVGGTPLSLITANVNSGTVPDLVVVNRAVDTVSVLVNKGTSFTVVTFATGSQPEGVVAADLNGDERVDLAVANAGSNNVSVFLNTGDDSSGNPTFAPAVNYPVGSSPTFIVALDLDGANGLDLAVANRLSNDVTELINNGAGVFTSGDNLPAGVQPVAITVGDFDKDGLPDLAVANFSSNNVSVLLSKGGTAPPSPASLGGPFSLVSGDFEGNGNADLVVANFNASTLLLLRNNGDGSFSSSTTLTGPASPSFVTSADMDGDGRPDLLVADAAGILLFTNYGGGQFFVTRSGTFNATFNSIAVANFRGTGQQVAVADELNNVVDLLAEATAEPTGPAPDCSGAGGPAGCGAGTCGGGAATAVPMSLIGLSVMRFTSPRRRRNAGTIRTAR